MAGETMQAMPMSPRQLPTEIGNAAVQWACSRRGRMTLLTAVFFTVLLGLTGIRHHEVIASNYQRVSSKYPWRPHLPKLPSIIPSHFRTPSDTTLQLENGNITHVPPNLKKTTPNFHLLMPSEKDSHEFCKTTLSAMLLKYPPPTVVNLHEETDSDLQRERKILDRTLKYLGDPKFVQDEDLVLVVDGEKSWFQLPSDVIIAQYKKLLEDANTRLLDKYGVNDGGYQKHNQTIVFGADKFCRNDDMACKYVPHSILPHDIYGKDVGRRIADMPARFLDAKMHMGPARDLRTLYKAAYDKLEENRSQAQTIQSVFATIFGEQQLKRDASEKPKKAADTVKASQNVTQHEYSIGLDYEHLLFQPTIYCTEGELVALKHDNETDLSQYQHPDSWPQDLKLPAALLDSKPPYWRPDLVKHNPSPNIKPAYIDKLEFAVDLDRLPKRKVAWAKIPLFQNTFTGAVPAIVLNNPLAATNANGERAPHANISFYDMWYARHKRALLRSYFRTTQSSSGYHDALVGGDRAWDKRGGRGGVWTATESLWLPWGEADGVCGTVSQLTEVFNDGKGVWLHEKDDNGEEERIKLVADLAKERENQKKADEEHAKAQAALDEARKNRLEEAKKKAKEKEQKAEEEKKKAEEEKKKAEDEKNKAKEEEEKQRQEAEAKLKAFEEEEKQRKEAEAKLKKMKDEQSQLDKEREIQDKLATGDVGDQPLSMNGMGKASMQG